MKPCWRAAVILFVLGWTFPVAPAVSAGEEAIPPDAFRRTADLLAGRRVSKEEDLAGGARVRGEPLKALFRQTVRAVPFVVAQKGFGSAAVIARDQASALVVTNHHVVEPPFRNDKGVPFVVVMFHEPALAGEIFDPRRLDECLKPESRDAWCTAFRRASRLGVVLGTDAERDLALLEVANPPAGVVAIPPADVRDIEPGDDVVVIGHPRGFLWTLTTGIVSAVRSNYPMGRSLGTVVQTQTPISPGNSGGPLMTVQGRVVGIVAWGHREAQSLNAAIATNEVLTFVSTLSKRLPQR